MDRITIADLARATGVSRSTIGDWKRKPEFAACFDGKELDALKVIGFLYAWKETASQASLTTSPKEAKLYWDAKRSEARFKEDIGELVSKSEYLETEKERLHILRHNILDLPTKLATELCLEESQKGQVELVCRNLLMTIKETFTGKEDIWRDLINGKTLSDD